MKAINEILKTQTGRKMIANLSYLKDTDSAKLSEFNWIDELPYKQQELFDTIYQLMGLTRVELAFKLIKGEKL